MPTSSSNRPEIDVEQYIDYIQTHQRTWTTTTSSAVYSDTFFYENGTVGPPPEPNRWQKAAATRKRYQQERLQMAELFATGSSKHLNCYLDKRGRLLVKMDSTYSPNPWLFVLDKRQLTVNNKLSKHLLPLLTGLAEREGVRLNLTDEMGRCLVDKAVAFWAFKGMVEVDDRELMRLATPKPLAQEAPTPSDTVTLNWTDFPTGQDVF